MKMNMRPMNGNNPRPPVHRPGRKGLRASRGRLYFLWHPGTKGVFSGYGLTIQPNRKDLLVGLLMVDRPQRVDPVWLDEIEARFGGYELYAMSVTGERGIGCQMYIAPDSLAYLRRSIIPRYLAILITQALMPLLRQPPRPRLKVRWNPHLRVWTSEFQEQQSDATTADTSDAADVVTKERSTMNEQPKKKALFELGQVVATPGALEALNEAGQKPDEFLYRHVTGDWDNLDPHDQKENERAIKVGNRVFSAYQTNKGVKIWVITEWDRSVTTLLLPSEY